MDPPRVASPSDSPADRDASHQAWKRPGVLALGRRTVVCVVESVSASTRPLRQTGRHPRGVSLARVRVDLLAVAAQCRDQGMIATNVFEEIRQRVAEEKKLTFFAGARVGPKMLYPNVPT